MIVIFFEDHSIIHVFSNNDSIFQIAGWFKSDISLMILGENETESSDDQKRSQKTW